MPEAPPASPVDDAEVRGNNMINAYTSWSVDRCRAPRSLPLNILQVLHSRTRDRAQPSETSQLRTRVLLLLDM